MYPDQQTDHVSINSVATRVPQGQPIRLAKWGRWLAGAVGMASMVAGGTATFTRTVEASPVALIVSGLLLLLVGLGGSLPRRLKLGDSEAEWEEELGEALGAIVAKLPQESRGDIAEALEDLEVIAPGAVAATYRGYARFQLLSDALQKVQIPGVRIDILSGPNDGYNAVAESATGDRAVFIALKNFHLRSRDLGPATRPLLAAIDRRGRDKARGLLVTPFEVTPLARKLADEDPLIDVVAVPTVDHAIRIELALKEALGLGSRD